MSNKIIFKKIRAKNFRSFGNQFIEIDLTQLNTLVCSDENGAGKSTGLTHALSFVLFDKTYQKGQKKPALVNSRNGKDCIVEVEFFAKGSEWKIVRGIKPNMLVIEKDGTILDNEASLKDPQKYIEETILGFDEKVFFNIALLGRDKFVSFAEMSSGEMRNFVEVLLDQGIFSVMNEVAKEDLKDVNRKIEDIGVDIRTNNTKLLSSTRIIDMLKSAIAQKKVSNDTLVSEIQTDIEALETQKTDKESQRPVLSEEVSRLTTVVQEERITISTFDTRIREVGLQSVRDAHNKVMTLVTQFDSRLSSMKTQRTQFMAKDFCPACEQPIAEVKKHEYCQKVDPQITALEGGESTLRKKLEDAKQELLDKETLIASIQTERNSFKTSDVELSATNSRVTQLDSTIRDLHNQIQTQTRRKMSLMTSGDTSKEESDLKTEEEVLTDLNRAGSELAEQEKQLYIHRDNIKSLLVFLKDDGVKGQIASQYLPFLNQKTNEYLDALNLWVNIQFDNEFGVTMSTPDRKGQGISDLSTGQMRRIDVAILLAWRDIAKLKASVDTNILCLDETLENLSAQGVADFVDMFATKCPDTSLFVITQRNKEFSEYFDKTLHFSLKDDFTVMREE